VEDEKGGKRSAPKGGRQASEKIRTNYLGESTHSYPSGKEKKNLLAGTLVKATKKVRGVGESDEKKTWAKCVNQTAEEERSRTRATKKDCAQHFRLLHAWGGKKKRRKRRVAGHESPRCGTPRKASVKRQEFGPGSGTGNYKNSEGWGERAVQRYRWGGPQPALVWGRPTTGMEKKGEKRKLTATERERQRWSVGGRPATSGEMRVKSRGGGKGPWL